MPSSPCRRMMSTKNNGRFSRFKPRKSPAHPLPSATVFAQKQYQANALLLFVIIYKYNTVDRIIIMLAPPPLRLFIYIGYIIIYIIGFAGSASSRNWICHSHKTPIMMIISAEKASDLALPTHVAVAATTIPLAIGIRQTFVLPGPVDLMRLHLPSHCVHYCFGKRFPGHPPPPPLPRRLPTTTPRRTTIRPYGNLFSPV